LSRRLLTSGFREATGMSVRQYQLELKTRLARMDLRRTPDIGLGELARFPGFYDEFHFSRTFKQRTGVSPSEFRRGLRF